METFFTWPIIYSVDLMTFSTITLTARPWGKKEYLYIELWLDVEEKKKIGRKSDCIEQRRI